MTWELFSTADWARIWKVRYMDGANIPKPDQVWEKIRAAEPPSSRTGGRRMTVERMLSALATFRAAYALFGPLALSPQGLQVHGLPEFDSRDTGSRKTSQLHLSVHGATAVWIKKDPPRHGLTCDGHHVRYKRPFDNTPASQVKLALQRDWYCVGGVWYPDDKLLADIADWAHTFIDTERSRGLLG